MATIIAIDPIIPELEPIAMVVQFLFEGLVGEWVGGIEFVVRGRDEGLVVVETAGVVGEREEEVNPEGVEGFEGLIEEGVVRIDVLGASEVDEGLTEEVAVDEGLTEEVEVGRRVMEVLETGICVVGSILVVIGCVGRGSGGGLVLSSQDGIPGMRSDGFIRSGLSGDIVAFAAPSVERSSSNNTPRKTFMFFFFFLLIWNSSGIRRLDLSIRE